MHLEDGLALLGQPNLKQITEGMSQFYPIYNSETKAYNGLPFTTLRCISVTACYYCTSSSPAHF